MSELKTLTSQDRARVRDLSIKIQTSDPRGVTKVAVALQIPEFIELKRLLKRSGLDLTDKDVVALTIRQTGGVLASLP